MPARPDRQDRCDAYREDLRNACVDVISAIQNDNDNMYGDLLYLLDTAAHLLSCYRNYVESPHTWLESLNERHITSAIEAFCSRERERMDTDNTDQGNSSRVMFNYDVLSFENSGGGVIFTAAELTRFAEASVSITSFRDTIINCCPTAINNDPLTPNEISDIMEAVNYYWDRRSQNNDESPEPTATPDPTTDREFSERLKTALDSVVGEFEESDKIDKVHPGRVDELMSLLDAWDEYDNRATPEPAEATTARLDGDTVTVSAEQVEDTIEPVLRAGDVEVFNRIRDTGLSYGIAQQTPEDVGALMPNDAITGVSVVHRDDGISLYGESQDPRVLPEFEHIEDSQDVEGITPQTRLNDAMISLSRSVYQRLTGSHITDHDDD